jgi:two-component system, NtrC family, sensor kinase
MSSTGPIMRDDTEVADMVNQARLATLGMMVAGLAHEINTPLGALNSNHDVLRRALNRLQLILEDEVVEPHELEEVRRVVRAIDGILQVNDMAVERMKSLIGGLRNFGRVDRAEIDVTDLHEGIESTLQIVAHELKPLRIVREFGRLPRVECLPHQINQVVMNLLLNARHATADDGTITVRTWAEEDVACIEISDTGTGMTADTVARIFEPGFTTKGGRIGMGLGLIISRQIMDRHNGSLAVRSEPGQGSSFTVRLPVRATFTQQTETDHAATNAPAP